ncbi:MAG: dynamin family protein [Lachnospiraceae bacterium]|nr:dynamin family protein [Lachnospiraceae bacterium]
MVCIKIRSNPYKRNVLFYSLDENNNWVEIKIDNGDSKLREEDSQKMFLPFRINKIIDIIRSEYHVPGGEKVTVVFEGTEDEYEEVKAVCSDEEVMDEIELIRSEEYLDDARDILKHTKEIFFNVQPILDNIIGDDFMVKKNLTKVADALDDIIPICVFGNYSAGKSTFINSLLGNEVLPSGGDPVTAKIYKISRSTHEDRINIEFSYRTEEIELRFDNNGYKVIKGNSDNDLIQVIDETIKGFETRELFLMASSTLDIINGFEKKDKNEIVISDVVAIEVPFSKNGILGQSNNRFVIFDTPGSNSNSNRDHADVLKTAMEGFSNGIPVWVSQYDSIDSIDNANLCDSIYAIEALDKRFTMIVINKADTAELPEDGWTDDEIKKFMEFDAIEKMYSGGIYFVSSVMGVGSKNNAKFISKFLRKTFKEKRESFSDPEDEEFYQTLYKYNIMPAQIKENAIEYSLANENLIYANSGLLCVEKEMETFASKHSTYNKCQMVYVFLNSVIDKSNQRINESKDMLNGYKAQEQSKLDCKSSN